MLTEEHEHEFVTILVGSELRERCKRCSAVRLVPNPGDSDSELARRIMHGANDPSMPMEDWMAMVARALQREYERETGLPAFAGSVDYAEWLKTRKHGNT